MNEEIEKNNAKVTLSSIQADTRKASKKLTAIYGEIDTKNTELVVAGESLARVQKKTEEALAKVEEERANLKREKEHHAFVVQRAKDELKIVKKQTSEALSELRRHNEWIFNAEQREKELEQSVSELSAKVAEKDGYIIDITDFQEKAAVEQQKLTDITLKIHLEEDNSEAKLHKIFEEIEDAKKELAELKVATKKEKNELQQLQSERGRIMKDLDVYIARIREQYEDAFPGRTMKI